jgi:hypothetical protein
VNHKPVEFDLLPFPNLVMHLLACLPKGENLGHNPKYGDAWKDWLAPEEMTFLTNDLQLSSPKTVETTATFSLLFQWPSYFCDEKIESGFVALEHLAKEPSLRQLLRCYPERAEAVNRYLPPRAHRFLLRRLPYSKKTCRELVSQYVQILQNLWDRSYKIIWNDVKERIRKHATAINERYLLKGGFVESWEQVTGVEYPYSTFRVVGLDSVSCLGVSLLAERDCFSLWIPEEKVFRFIVHEIGTHTVFHTKTISNKEWRAFFLMDLEGLLRLVENYCALKTSEVCSRLEVAVVENVTSREAAEERKVLERLLSTSPDLNAVELISRAHRELHGFPLYGVKKTVLGLVTHILF